MSATAKEIDCRGCAHVRSGAMQEPCTDCRRGPDGRGTRWQDKGAAQRKCETCAHQQHVLCPMAACTSHRFHGWAPRADVPAAAQEPAGGANAGERRHSHYFKDVSGLQTVDVYRVLSLFGVTDPCIQHALKKLLVAGGRGVKDQGRDVQEAIDTLNRWQEMRREDEGRAA